MKFTVATSGKQMRFACCKARAVIWTLVLIKSLLLKKIELLECKHMSCITQLLLLYFSVFLF
jgi:hypothetical protein